MNSLLEDCWDQILFRTFSTRYRLSTKFKFVRYRNVRISWAFRSTQCRNWVIVAFPLSTTKSRAVNGPPASDCPPQVHSFTCLIHRLTSRGVFRGSSTGSSFGSRSVASIETTDQCRFVYVGPDIMNDKLVLAILELIAGEYLTLKNLLFQYTICK